MGLLEPERDRRLTLPSSGLAPAAQAWPSFHSGPSPRRLREPLMSNVRRLEIPQGVEMSDNISPREAATTEDDPAFISPVQQELISILNRFRSGQEFLHGQVLGLRTALFSAFQHLQSEEALRARVESDLEARLRLMKAPESKEDPNTIAGYESTLKELITGFHAGNKGDVSH